MLVNNAGVYPAGRASRIDFDVVEETWQVNALGAWRLAVAAIPHMGRGARIVNVSSGRRLARVDGRDATRPTTSRKAALNAITRVLAADLRARRDPRQLGLPGLGAHRHGRRAALALGRGGRGERAVGGAAGRRTGRPAASSATGNPVPW